jgi:hypothetical protein
MMYRFLDSEVAGLIMGAPFMNYPSISVKIMSQSLPIAIGTLSITALIIAASISDDARETSVQRSITQEQSVGTQIRCAETSIERQYPAGTGESGKSGTAKKNRQRLDMRPEVDREEKAGGSSSTDRDQGSQRKVRRALA